MAKATKPCGVPLTHDRDGIPNLDGPACLYPRKHSKVKCRWHWALGQPIDVQVKEAALRLSFTAKEHEPRARVPEAEWPVGERWCAGCQSFVPLFYASGSQCRACRSKAAHASHSKRTYDLEGEEYDALLEWQGGVCFICGQRPRARRLAIDHDHVTGDVRGLLCANNEWGCNTQLARLLNDLGMAKRALEYVEVGPLARMRAGEASRGRPGKTLKEWLSSGQEPAAPPVSLAEWDPFAA